MADGLDRAVAPPPRPRPRWPLGLLGMLTLVALVESRLDRHDLDFTAPWHWDWRTAGKVAAKGEKASGRRVLLFGDSLLKFGVMPRVLADRSGKSAYNFALHTGQASSSYFMLRRALDAGARPDLIVLDLTPHMLRHGPQENAELWPELLSPSECLDMARAMGDASFFARTMLAKALPTFKERYALRAACLSATRGEDRSRRSENLTYRRNWKQNDGAQLMVDGTAPPIDPNHWVDTLYPRWDPRPVNVAYLDRFLDLAHARKIPVAWLLPPIHPVIQAKVKASGYDAELSGFVRAVQARHPGTFAVVDARGAGFGADEFGDGIHLNRRGALALSSLLGDAIRGAVEPDRWVSLDRGRVGPVDLPIEDVYQSALALQAAGSPPRRR